MTDRDKIEFLRAYCSGIGHTNGTPFESATVTMWSGRSYDIYPMTEIVDLIQELEMAVMLKGADGLSYCEKFVYYALKSNNIIQAFICLAEYEEENNKGE